MESNVRTMFGNALQTAMLQGLPLPILENSTLNEKFNVEPGVLPSPDVLPKMKYFAIGNGGHAVKVTDNGFGIDSLQHESTDAACFKHLPFALRELNNDLSPTERAKYGLRREETYNGTRYIAYYLKRLDLLNVNVEMSIRTVQEVNGVVTTVPTPFIPDSSNLNPVPKPLNPSTVNTIEGSYGVCSAVEKVVLTANDINEIIEAVNIMYGDTSLAIISEIAYVSGVDRAIDVNSNGNVIRFNEVIAAQVNTFVAVVYPLTSFKDGITTTIDIGAVEPLFRLTQG